MKVYELAKLKGLNAKDVARELGLSSHLSVVSEPMLKGYLEGLDIADDEVCQIPLVEDVIEEVIEITVNNKVVALDSEKIGSIKGLGAKSPYWNERQSLGFK